MHKLTSIIIMFLCILIAAGCSGPIKPPYELGNDPMNAHQFGFTVQDGDWLYYVDRENRIARTNGTITETYENTYGRGLNLYRDYIYFTPHAEGFGGIDGLYRFHKEKPEQIESVIQNTHLGNFIIINDHLYYSHVGDETSGMSRSNLDGGKEKQFLEGLTNGFQFYEGWLYVAIPGGGSVLKVSSNGKVAGNLQTEDGMPISTTSFIIHDDWIYFENRDDELDERYVGEASKQFDHIFRMKLDGSGLEYLTAGALSLVSEGPYIYYMFQETDGDERQLIRMNVETGEKNVLYQGERFFSWGNKVGDHLYFVDWGSDPEEATAVFQMKVGGEKLEVFVE